MAKERVGQMGGHIALAHGTARGGGHVSVGMRICPRCKNTRFSAVHKSKCKNNNNPVWN